MVPKPKPRSSHELSKYTKKGKQDINRALKYIIFFINFIFFLVGMICIGLGIYVYVDQFRPIIEALDFLLNPAILLIACGCIIFLISFLGCTGALRENVIMLKLFGLTLFASYVILVIMAFVVFLLFYTDAETGVSMHSLMMKWIKRYHINDNVKDVMDVVQKTLQCCGTTSQGYKDWNLNPHYNCSSSAQIPSVQRCSVPHSCCVDNANPTLPSASNTRLPASNIPATCGFNAQRKSTVELEGQVYTDGCLHKFRSAFEGHAVIIGAIIGAIIIPVCLSITLSNVLWKQIERQRYRLERQARREERWRRKLKSRFRDPFHHHHHHNHSHNQACATAANPQEMPKSRHNIAEPEPNKRRSKAYQVPVQPSSPIETTPFYVSPPSESNSADQSSDSPLDRPRTKGGPVIVELPDEPQTQKEPQVCSSNENVPVMKPVPKERKRRAKPNPESATGTEADNKRTSGVENYKKRRSSREINPGPSVVPDPIHARDFVAQMEGKRGEKRRKPKTRYSWADPLHASHSDGDLKNLAASAEDRRYSRHEQRELGGAGARRSADFEGLYHNRYSHLPSHPFDFVESAPVLPPHFEGNHGGPPREPKLRRGKVANKKPPEELLRKPKQRQDKKNPVTKRGNKSEYSSDSRFGDAPHPEEQHTYATVLHEDAPDLG